MYAREVVAGPITWHVGDEVIVTAFDCELNVSEVCLRSLAHHILALYRDHRDRWWARVRPASLDNPMYNDVPMSMIKATPAMMIANAVRVQERS